MQMAQCLSAEEIEEKGKLDDRWRMEYCESENKWRKCIRYQMEERDEQHPDNMLPDGRIEKGLE